PKERAKAMGFFGFVAAGGGSIGVLLGGFLTSALNWHWIFLVNIPVGIAVFIASLYLLSPVARDAESAKHLDVFGALSVTAALMLAVYAIVNGNTLGWTSWGTLGMLGASILLLIIFLYTESKVRSPLVPLSFF